MERFTVRATRSTTSGILIVATLLLSSCAATSRSSAAAVSCRYTEVGHAVKAVGLPPATATVAAKTATLTTNQGTITISLDAARAPCTVNSLSFLAGKKYFDATPCHRLTTSGIFVLQCGDPSGTGAGNPGYHFAGENLAGATYPAGTVAMANAGPGTNGSQFFLVYQDTTLQPNYTPFGTITGGLDVVRKVAIAGADGSHGPGDGAPRLAIHISTLRVAKGKA
jgi:peptidyl-prolyl cis-trans isomerase B (cyclophilin B)